MHQHLDVQCLTSWLQLQLLQPTSITAHRSGPHQTLQLSNRGGPLLKDHPKKMKTSCKWWKSEGFAFIYMCGPCQTYQLRSMGRPLLDHPEKMMRNCKRQKSMMFTIIYKRKHCRQVYKGPNSALEEGSSTFHAASKQQTFNRVTDFVH